MTVEIAFQGAHVYRDDTDPALWRFWPEHLAPEVGPDGRPTLSVVVLGTQTMLQLGTRWSGIEELHDALQKHLNELLPQQIALRLEAAPANVGEAVLEIGDGTGDFQPLAKATTSGFYPHQAIFSATVDVEGKNRVANALAGRTGWLRVRYDMVIDRPLAIEGRLSGDARAIGATTDPEEARRAVESGLADGSIVIEMTESDPRDAEVLGAVKEMLIAQAALVLRSAPQAQPTVTQGPARFEVTARAGSVRQEPRQIIGDVGEWFADGSGQQHLSNLATGS